MKIYYDTLIGNLNILATFKVGQKPITVDSQIQIELRETGCFTAFSRALEQAFKYQVVDETFKQAKGYCDDQVNMLVNGNQKHLERINTIKKLVMPALQGLLTLSKTYAKEAETVYVNQQGKLNTSDQLRRIYDVYHTYFSEITRENKPDSRILELVKLLTTGELAEEFQRRAVAMSNACIKFDQNLERTKAETAKIKREDLVNMQFNCDKILQKRITELDKILPSMSDSCASLADWSEGELRQSVSIINSLLANSPDALLESSPDFTDLVRRTLQVEPMSVSDSSDASSSLDSTDSGVLSLDDFGPGFLKEEIGKRRTAAENNSDDEHIFSSDFEIEGETGKELLHSSGSFSSSESEWGEGDFLSRYPIVDSDSDLYFLDSPVLTTSFSESSSENSDTFQSSDGEVDDEEADAGLVMHVSGSDSEENSSSDWLDFFFRKD